MPCRLAFASFLVIESVAVLQAGRDVPPPERINYVAPQYPAIAAQVVPAPIVGVIILEVTLAEDGHPTDIKVLYGIPLLDKAAIDAVIKWRYKPTLVNGEPRRVVLREVVDMFPDLDAERQYFAAVVQNKKEQKLLRIIAADRLGKQRGDHPFIMEALKEAAKDADPDVSSAASRALEALGRGSATHNNKMQQSRHG